MEGRISVGIFRPKYVDHLQNIPVKRNRNESCHLNFDRNFRNLWHNRNWRKIALVTECAHCFMGLWFSNVRYIEKHPSRCVLWLESKLVYVICRHQTNFGSSRLRYKSIDCLPVEIFTRKRRWWEVCGTSFEDFRPRSTCMERQNCLMVLVFIILGAYSIILGAYVFICGAFFIIFGAYPIILGAYVFICGAFFIIFGAYSIILGAYVFLLYRRECFTGN